MLISGRGSNMLALADAAARADAAFEIALVAADRADAPGLDAAAARGLGVATLASGSKAAREADLLARLDAVGADLVAMAGFMRVLSADCVEALRDRALNVHPSLLPSFRGLDTHARALRAGVKIHGATVHVARAALDDGPILAQAALVVAPGETAESLAARVLALEHALYPAALDAYAAGRLALEGGGVAGGGVVAGRLASIA